MLLPQFKSVIIGFSISFLREGKWFINIFHFTAHCINHWTDPYFRALSAQPCCGLGSGKGLLSSGHFLGLSVWKGLSWVNSDISLQLSFAVLKEVNSQWCCVTVEKTNQKGLPYNFEAGILLEEANHHNPLRYSLFFALTHNPSCTASCCTFKAVLTSSWLRVKATSLEQSHTLFLL